MKSEENSKSALADSLSNLSIKTNETVHNSKQYLFIELVKEWHQNIEV